jgi:opacity protein-like surface antigen
MRSFVILTVGMLAFGGVADAQSAAPGKGYVEGVAQSAFGNVMSQSYGAEGGFAVTPGLWIFLEGGRIRDIATAAIGTAAQKIAGSLTETQPLAVAYHVKEPATFAAVGLKYEMLASGNAHPYVMAGGGVARVKQDVTFSVGGTDVTGNLQQSPYFVTLGTDLSGAFTKPMLTAGAGVAWPAWKHLVLDFQYRYGRIFADDQAINVSRAGLGVGVRF